MSEDGPGQDGAARRLRRAAILLGAGVVLAAIIGFVLVFRFAEANRDRDLGIWRDRLTISADARAAAVDDWISAERDMVATVARNPTLEFYLTERAAVGAADRVTDGAARLEMIRTYLLFSADQSGFNPPPGGAEIAANIPRARRGGLALVDMTGRLLSGTSWMPSYEALLTAYKAAPPEKGAVYIHDIYAGEAGEPTLALVAPVYALEGAADGVTGAPLGYVIAVRPAADLYSRLSQPGDVKAGIETVLLRSKAGRIEDLSALGKSVPADDRTLAASQALADPGLFVRGRDGQGHDVLATATPLKTIPALIMSSVEAGTALNDITARRNATLTIFGLVILCLAAAALLLWRYGASLRASASAARATAMAARYERLSAFLRGVSDAQPTGILAFDADGHCRFANERAAAAAGISDSDLSGKTARAIFGPTLGTGIEADNRAALTSSSPVSRSHTLALADGKRQILKADHMPLGNMEGDQGHRPGVLVVLEDVTALVSERERREDNLRQLVSTLTGVIDSRDPYAARHSRWVADLAKVLARDMGLDDVMVETAEVAGALLNLGKVLVPRALLTKNEALSAAELEDVRLNIQKSADLLQGVAFNGPVVATIRQAQAHWDGSGLPAGLAGSDILVTARILAVANAFVGMISARSHRAALPLETVIDLLLGQAGTLYDRRPVAALVNYLENQGGRALWAARALEPGE
ncbi:HD domain-containing phosphohydrolase [Govanella unica]|uniref:PAS domain-containing protein n=1 Tax=Govanella unica TaxID=2975056 RepID=A0A9X3Z7T6_9PROT|nr:HD domain-containing phosphohydrolase [Govania unica]MDA5194491.1 PAS domain-containing protein [Govania unica]